MSLLIDILISLLVLIGSFFIFVGSVGLLRLPDLFMRLHAPAKASTLGLGCFLLASMLYSAVQFRFGFPELLITLLSFITAPVSANLLAQAAIHLNLRSRSGRVPESIDLPSSWQSPKDPKQKNHPP